MEKMDKGLTVPKSVLIVWPKIPQNLSAQLVCSSPKFLDLNEKRLHWASVVRDLVEGLQKHDHLVVTCVTAELLNCGKNSFQNSNS